ncbi:hypothetical protein HDV05_006892 [Chytridiales sp. JEL 0842]|nr:hypothetical protein HDV05_006892 [Chytridiales sp. JEL 0842]
MTPKISTLMFPILLVTIHASLSIAQVPNPTQPWSIDWETYGGQLLAVGMFDGISTASNNGYMPQANQWSSNSTENLLVLRGFNQGFASNTTDSLNNNNNNNSIISTAFSVLGSYHTSENTRFACFFESNTNELILAGNFASLPGLFWRSAVVRYNTNSRQFSPVGDGLSSFISSASNQIPFPSIDALFCDNTSGDIWVSSSAVPGQLARFSTTTPDATWEFGANTVSGGLNGRVFSIVSAPPINGTNSEILLGGSFDSTMDPIAMGPMGSFQQMVRFTPTLRNRADSLDATTLSCDGNKNSWTLGSNRTQGELVLNLASNTNLSGISLTNINVAGSGTLTFGLMITSGNSSRLLPLSRVNPTNGMLSAPCTRCGLDLGVVEQQFMVNATAATSVRTVRLLVFSSLNVGGFRSVKLFTKDVLVKADQRLNPIPCAASTIPVSRSSAPASWRRVTQAGTTSLQHLITSSRMLTANTSMTFTPAITNAGNVDMFLEMPPCGTFDRCSQRGRVRVEVFTTTTSRPFASVLVDQNVSRLNNRVRVFRGSVASSSSTGLPFVRISVVPPTGVNATARFPISLVATELRVVYRPRLTGLGGLARLVRGVDGSRYFEAFRATLPPGSVVRSIDSAPDGRIFVGGSFRVPAANATNVAYFANSRFVSVAEGGLNGPVNSLVYFNGNVYVTGNFSTQVKLRPTARTLILRNIAQFSAKDNAWQPMGSGLSSSSMRLSLDRAGNSIYVSGPFNSRTDSVGAIRRQTSGIPSWNITSGVWTSNGMAAGTINFVQALQSPSSGGLLVSGRLSSFGAVASGSLAGLDSSGIDSFSTSAFNQTLDFRTAGYDGADMIYVGGNFRMSTNPPSVNVGMYSTLGRTWRYPGFSTNGPVLNVEVVTNGRTLWVLGNFTTARTDKEAVQVSGGLCIYSLDQANDGAPTRVNTVRYMPSQNSVIVSGQFSKAGDKACVNICIWDIRTATWNPVSLNAISGRVLALEPISDMLLAIGGEFSTVVSNTTATRYFALYDFWKGTLLFPTGAISSAVREISSTNNGFVFLLSEDSSVYTFETSSTTGVSPLALSVSITASSINSIKSVNLNSSTAPGADANPVLILSGSINLGDRTASAVVVDRNGLVTPFLFAANRNGRSGILYKMIPLLPPSFVSMPPKKPLLPSWAIIVIGVGGSLVVLTIATLIVVAVTKSRRNKRQLSAEKAAGGNGGESGTDSKKELDKLEKSTIDAGSGLAVVKVGEKTDKPAKEVTTELNRVTPAYKPQTEKKKPKARADGEKKRHLPQDLVGYEEIDSDFDESSQDETRHITYPPPALQSTSSSPNSDKLWRMHNESGLSTLFEADSNRASVVPRELSHPSPEMYDTVSYHEVAMPPLAQAREGANALPNNGDLVPAAIGMDVEDLPAAPILAHFHNNNKIKASAAATPITKPAASEPNKSTGVSSSEMEDDDHSNHHTAWGTALYSFAARDDGELAFEAGDRILVIDRSDPVWWMGMVDRGDGTVGVIGVFPMNFIKVDDEDM